MKPLLALVSIRAKGAETELAEKAKLGSWAWCLATTLFITHGVLPVMEFTTTVFPTVFILLQDYFLPCPFTLKDDLSTYFPGKIENI